MTRPSLARRCLAEAIATFALVFAGCGAIVANAERDGALGSNGIALTFGLVIMVMVYATGHLSGPVAGAALGGFAYQLVRGEHPQAAAT